LTVFRRSSATETDTHETRKGPEFLQEKVIEFLSRGGGRWLFGEKPTLG
jgi:hypothetical protein